MSFFRMPSAWAAVPLLAVFLLSAAPAALARPEMAGRTAASRFAEMDADKDGKLSREEFFAAQPNMKETAFEALDADRDSGISAAEWEGFAAGHGKSEAPMPHGQPSQSRATDAPAIPGATGEAAGNDGGQFPALIMPPAQR